VHILLQPVGFRTGVIFHHKRVDFLQGDFASEQPLQRVRAPSVNLERGVQDMQNHEWKLMGSFAK